MLKAERIMKLFFCLLAFWALNFGCQPDTKADTVAPSFSLPGLDGEDITLEQYRGKVVLLDFWATWCPPCRLSIPELVKLQSEYEDDGLVVLGVSVDDKRQFKNEYLKAFKEKYKINYIIARYNDRVMRDYFSEGSPAIPTMFVIDREGHIRDKVVGYNPGALKEALSPLLKK